MSDDNYIISDADKSVCLGSGEIKPCPFCGRRAHSVGTKHEETGNTVYRVICAGLHRCGATVYCCSKDPDEARRGAIANWNVRTKEAA